jgi:GNAT superfamily N-acetyltransferase
MITRIEEYSANAWPAQKTLFVEGWAVRFAGGYTRRANSVLPLHGGPDRLPERVAACEALFRLEGLRPVFKMTGTAPADLDALLAEEGYAIEAPTVLMGLENCVGCAGVAGVAGVAAGAGRAGFPGSEASVLERPDAEWFEAWAAFSGPKEADLPIARAILSNIVPERRFLLLRKQGRPVACALVVIEGGWAGIFDVVVKPEERGRGLGRGIMKLALDAAIDAGARSSYLQVVEGNTPAQNLYASLGYRPLYNYWYRTRSAS